LSGLNSTRAYLQAGARIKDVSQRFSQLGLQHTVSGPVFDFHSPDWIDAGKMAGLMSLLLAAAALASLAVFCKLLPAVVCSALCLINLLQLAAMLWASGIPLNLLTCTGAALAFPVMFFVNLMLVFQLSLQPPPSPAAAELALTPWPGAEDTRPAEEADSGSRQKQRSDNVEASGQQQQLSKRRPQFRPDWPLAALLWAAALAAPTALAAFAASAFPGSPLLTACLGGPLVAG
uniref:MMPL domain-containing protein n=1 Tax=Macrostomum lignano TaxID=282301 RepID=A0A1I8INB3_9PLAT